MQTPEPVIVYKEKYGKTGLFKSIVEYPDLNTDNYPYQLKRQFITKELKILNNTHIGIKLNPVFCEAFINKSFKSPYLNTAEYVTVQNGTIVLFFNEAVSDFHRSGRNNFSRIKQWIKSVVKGIVQLHLGRILHGDISASNILIFNSMAKLSDFGSSALILDNNYQHFTSKLYKPTHRAPEVWRSSQWNLSADMWALGCTIYEMIYGMLLFQVKNTNEEYINQINSWCDPNNISENFEISSEWNNPIYEKANKLILKLLRVNPSERPTIFDVLKDPFFEDDSYVSLSSSPESISLLRDSDLSNIKDDVKQCNYELLKDCPIIARRVYDKNNFNNDQRVVNMYKKLQIYESDREIKLLVICMYHELINMNLKINFEITTLLLIVHLLVHRDTPRLLTITRETINEIINISLAVDFKYIPWNKFYGIYERFIY